MSKIDLIIDALSVAQNSVWSALNQEALAYAIELKLELAKSEERVCCGDYEKCWKACTPRGRWLAEQEVVKPEAHIVKWSIPVDPNNFGEPLAQPEQELTEEGKAWGEMAKKMSRDFMENAKKNWEPPPKDVGTITIGELRKTDLYRRMATQSLRETFAPQREWLGLTDKEIEEEFGHADNWGSLLDSLESELRDVLGHYREAFKAQPEQGCAECGVKEIDGYALYCVACTEKFVGGYKENVPVHTSELLTQVFTGNQYAGNGTAGIKNETKPTGFFFQMPPRKPWVGLTDDDLDTIYREHHDKYGADLTGSYERSIEAKLKELNK